MNNPLKYIDPSGEYGEFPGGGLGVNPVGDGSAIKETLEYDPVHDWLSKNLSARSIDKGASAIGQGVVNGINSIAKGIRSFFGGGGNSRSESVPYIATSVNMNAYNANPGGNSSLSRLGDINTRYRTTYDFFGADVRLDAPKLFGSIYNRTTFGTIHTSYSFYNDYVMHGLDSKGGMLLMHEYGHYLHSQSAPVNFYSYAMWSSFATAGFSWADTNWTEIRANTMAYYYFGQPKYKYWDPKKYPIDSNYLSKQEIYQLTHRLKPFNP